ncbi:MAG: hypothetical protein EA370_16890 [Wenzhouxiangella sp.]|nr:MAG: hypothetical protein EA370_16890 [Wenzhouxiangella sp.]
MNHRPIAVLIAIVIALAAVGLVACERGAEISDEPDMTEPETVMEHDAPEALDLDDSLAQAKAHMAEALDVDPDAVEVLESRPVTWPDGALGCPEPDMAYTQALVEGFYFRLRVDAEVRAYHAGANGVPFHCPTERSRPAPRQPDRSYQ